MNTKLTFYFNRLQQIIDEVQDTTLICETLLQAQDFLRSKERKDVKKSLSANDVTFAAGEKLSPVNQQENSLQLNLFWSYQTFTKLLLTLVYEKLTEEEQTLYILPFFLEVDSVVSVGCIISFLSQAQSIQQVQTGQTILLKALESGQFCSLLEVDKWHEVFPKKSWSDCCEELVGWLISIPELVSKHSHKPNHCFLSSAFFKERIQECFSRIFSTESTSRESPICALLGLLMKRLICRGFGHLVVQTLFDCAFSKHSETSSSSISFLFLVQSIQDPYAMEKFYQILLLHLEKQREDSFEMFRRFVVEADSEEIPDEVSYILFNKILQKQELPKAVCHWFVHLLSLNQSRLGTTIHQLVRVWANAQSVDQTPLPRQGYITHLLLLSLPLLSLEIKKFQESRMYSQLLEGVSNRLGSCLETIRFQGMRIAEVLASLESYSQPLFEDIEVDFHALQPDEVWESPPESAQLVEELPTQLEEEEEVDPADSDDESDFCSVAGEDLEPLDLTEGPEKVFKRGDRPTTLVDLLQDLKSAEEPMKTVSSLKQLVVLMKQNPPELNSLSIELAKTLVHVHIPDWIPEELKKDDAFELKEMKSPSEVRVCCMKTLMEQTPANSGEIISQLVSSRQLTIHQRLEILESMRQAAVGLSSPPKAPHLDSSRETECLEDGKTRIWGKRALEVARKRNLPSWRNHFVEVVGLWTTNLLIAAKAKISNYSIIEKSPKVLGALLITLGCFADCCVDSIGSVSLSLVCFPLLKTVLEEKSENCFLRRCAFQSLASMMKTLPLSRVASVLNSVLEPTNEADKALVEMFVWTQDKAREAMEKDSDQTTKLLASSCSLACQRITRLALETQANVSTTGQIGFPRKTKIEIKLPSIRL